MNHLPEHTYAFIKDGVVENVCVFADHDDELADLLAKNSGSDQAVDCCLNGNAFIGGTWDGIEFKPAQPFPSWTWDAEAKAWVSPTPKPTDGIVYWDEENLSWVEVILPAE